MTGVMRSRTRALMRAVNAAPITTATARSTTLPRRMKARNSLRISGMAAKVARAAVGAWVARGGERTDGCGRRLGHAGRRTQRRLRSAPGSRLAAVLSTPGHGPLALLRRHRRVGADGPSGPARPAPAPRRRPAAVRLRRGHPAPAAAHRRPARYAGRVPDPPPRRPLARPARDAQVLRAARSRGAAHGVRAARDECAHGGDADRLRPPA